MPVMNGIEMIRQAKEQYPDMTFVVLSGYGDYEFTSQAMELGCGITSSSPAMNPK